MSLSLESKNLPHAAAAFALAPTNILEILHAVDVSQLSAVLSLLESLPLPCSSLSSLKYSISFWTINSLGGTYLLPLYCLYHSSLEFASSLPTTLRILIPADQNSGFHANSLLSPLAFSVSGMHAISFGVTNSRMSLLDPQIKDTINKLRNPISYGHFTLPSLSHSFGLISSASAKPIQTPLSQKSN